MMLTIMRSISWNAWSWSTINCMAHPWTYTASIKTKTYLVSCWDLCNSWINALSFITASSILRIICSCFWNTIYGHALAQSWTWSYVSSSMKSFIYHLSRWWWQHAYCFILCWFVLTILTQFLRLWQWIFLQVPDDVLLSDLWLTDGNIKFIFFILEWHFMLPFIIICGLSIFYRILICWFDFSTTIL